MAGRSRKTMGEIRIRITIKRVGDRLRSELRRGGGGGPWGGRAVRPSGARWTLVFFDVPAVNPLQTLGAVEVGPAKILKTLGFPRADWTSEPSGGRQVAVNSGWSGGGGAGVLWGHYVSGVKADARVSDNA